MRAPAKGVYLEIGIEGSNPSFHAKEQFNKEVATMYTEQNMFIYTLLMSVFNINSKDWFYF